MRPPIPVSHLQGPGMYDVDYLNKQVGEHGRLHACFVLYISTIMIALKLC